MWVLVLHPLRVERAHEKEEGEVRKDLGGMRGSVNSSFFAIFVLSLVRFLPFPLLNLSLLPSLPLVRLRGQRAI